MSRASCRECGGQIAAKDLANYNHGKPIHTECLTKVLKRKISGLRKQKVGYQRKIDVAAARIKRLEAKCKAARD